MNYNLYSSEIFLLAICSYYLLTFYFFNLCIYIKCFHTSVVFIGYDYFHVKLKTFVRIKKFNKYNFFLLWYKEWHILYKQCIY